MLYILVPYGYKIAINLLTYITTSADVGSW